LSTHPDARTGPKPALRENLREVATLAYPVVLTQLSATLMGVVDSAMVGRLGPTELAAVGFGAIWMWTIFSLIFGTASGIQTFVSQEDGAGRPQECGRWAWQGLYAVLPFAVLLVALLAPSIEPLLELLGPSPELRAAAGSYIGTRLIGELGLTVIMVVTPFFRGIGDTKTPLYVTLFANAVNGVLDYGLIFGRLGLPEWGVAGAGAATAVANGVGAVAILCAFRMRAKTQPFHTQPRAPHAADMWRFLRTSAPIGGQWSVGMMAFALFTTVVARMGDASMAASQAFVMLLSFSFMQAIGISIAASTLVGRYIGAGDLEGAAASFRASALLGVALALLVAAVFIAIPVPLLRLFTDDPGVMELGRPLVILGALFQLFDALAIIVEGALRGAGDTRWPFAIQTFLGFGLFVPLAYLLGVVLGGGLQGAWLGALINIIVMTLVLLWRFQSRAWQRIQI
jgi:putative MATE family efflux protein